MSSGIEPLVGGAASVDEAVRRLAVERSHDLITLLDPAGTIVYGSPSWAGLGWEPDELPGTPILELIHPDELGPAAAAIAQVVGGGDLDAITIRIRRADGGWVFFETTGSAIRDEGGELRFLLGTARDVSEREELRARLRDLDAVYRFADAVAGAGRLESVLDAALDALLEATGADRASILLADADGVFRFRAWRGLSDEYRAATEGHTPWPPGASDPEPVLVADVAAAGFERSLERAVRREGIGALAFVPLVHGERLLGKFMLYHDEPYDWTDREVRLCATIASHLASVTVRMHALEDLHDSREQLSAILRTVDEAITVHTPAGTLAYANDAAARRHGFATVAELLATPWTEVLERYDLMDEDGTPVSADELPSRRALGGSGGSRLVRYRIRETQEERWSSVRSNPVLGADGEPAFAVTVTNDVTVEQRSAQSERVARARLALLLEATARLAETTDYEETLRRVPELAVPALAESCHVYIAREDGTQLVRVAYASADPEVKALLDSIDPVYEVGRDRRISVVQVFRTGKPFHRPTLRQPLTRIARPGEEHLIRMDSRSLIVLPLEAAGRRLGVLVLASREPGRHGEEDFELARELARRVSLALDAVALHRRAQDSLARLQAVLAQLPVGVVIADAPAGNLVMRNEAVERIWEREVPLGQPLSDYDGFARWRPDGAAVDWEGWPIARALAGDVVIGERQEFERRDGSRRTMEISSAPVRDERGEIVAAVSIFNDVTDRTRAEERVRFLSQARELLAGSLDWEKTLGAVADLAVPALAGYLVVDLLDEEDELRCVAAAHADPEKAALVRRLRDEYPPTLPTHPVQVALRTGEPVLLADLQAEIGSMAQDEKHARAIRRIANTSGIVVPLVARGRTLGTISLGTIGTQPRFDEADLDAAVELARRASIALDNARLFREAQQRAHAAEALEFVDNGVFLLDGSGTVRLWNPAAEACFRISAADAIGRRAADLIADWEALSARIPVASEPRGISTRPQTLPVDARGEERWLSISAVRFPGGTVYAFRDLTEERAVEQMKSDFVSTVSHELRTPLAAIYGAALTLRRDDVTLEGPQRSGLLEVIASEADRLARIVNDILWVSRLESAGLSVAIEHCDAGALARQVVEAQRVRLPPGVRIETTVAERLPPVAADPDKLRQVLTNLLDNAVKYSPDGGLIELELSRTGRRIRFRVGDEGLGVPPAEQDRIFEKFFRLDPNLARGVGGTGLGLYITRELVTRMDGRIWVVSDGRRGSSFFVELPTA